MNKWKQNIALADESGWERGPAKSSVCGPGFLMEGQHWHRKSEKDCWIDCCPNFVESLDLMHEVEEFQFYRDVLWNRKYAREIHKIVVRDFNKEFPGSIPTDPSETGWFSWYLGIHATAEQRAEAVLRTLDRWEE